MALVRECGIKEISAIQTAVISVILTVDFPKIAQTLVQMVTILGKSKLLTLHEHSVYHQEM